MTSAACCPEADQPAEIKAMSTTESDPIGFWDNRHRTVDEWRSGGDRGLSVRSNQAFYLHRLGELVSILDCYLASDNLRVLDAGCGKGWLTNELSRLGHRVVGIDSSETAIEICERHRAGSFFRAPLSEFWDIRGFDVAISMDVLFHVLDDGDWRQALLGTARNVRFGGLLVVTDVPDRARHQMGTYIVHRPIDEYLAVLTPAGYELKETRPYRFAGNPNALITFRRE